MTASALDLATTKRFIDYRPVDVTIKRRAKVDTAAGGKKLGPPVDKGPFTVRIVELGQIGSRVQRLTSSGDLAVPTHRVTCMPDIDAQRHDTFEWDDVEWEVLWVSKLPEWRIELEVIGHG